MSILHKYNIFRHLKLEIALAITALKIKQVNFLESFIIASKTKMAHYFINHLWWIV